MTRRATAIKWICYCLGALVLVLLEGRHAYKAISQYGFSRIQK